MNVGVTATRSGLTATQKQAAARLLQSLSRATNDPDVFHYGLCVGGDDETAEIAREAGYRLVGHPGPDPGRRGLVEPDVLLPVRPFLARNRDIVDESLILLGFPKEEPGREPHRGARGAGTWWTIRHAVDVGRIALIVWPDGTEDPRADLDSWLFLSAGPPTWLDAV